MMLAGLADVVGGDPACLTHLDLDSQPQVAIRWPPVVSDTRVIGAYPTVGHTPPSSTASDTRAEARRIARTDPDLRCPRSPCLAADPFPPGSHTRSNGRRNPDWCRIYHRHGLANRAAAAGL
jgi:hypothetical protein